VGEEPLTEKEAEMVPVAATPERAEAVEEVGVPREESPEQDREEEQEPAAN